MNSCEALSDRMPAVASGRATWTAGEAAHLATCADCRAEWELVAAARTLGRDVVPGRAPEAMAAAALAQDRAARHADARRRTTRWAISWGGLAAAAMLMLAVLFRQPGADAPAVATTPDPAPVAAVAFRLSLPELDDADPEELQAVLDGLDVPLGESSTLDGGVTDDVTGPDMERVLRAWEG